MTTAASSESGQGTSSRWLKAAQVGWIALAITVLIFLVASLPAAYVLFNSDGEFDYDPLWLIPIALVTVLCLGLAALLFWKKRDEWMALFLAYFFLLYGIVMIGPLEVISQFAGSDQILELGYAFLTVPFLILLFIFPSGRFVPSWSRWLVPVVILIGPPLKLIEANLDGAALSYLSNLEEYVLYGLLISGLYGQVVRYSRISSPTERLQMKWVLYGFSLFFLIMFISSLPWQYLQSLPPVTPEPWWAEPAGTLYFVGQAVIPITFTVSILRYRLWDIDLIIRRTLVYGLLTAIILAIYFGSVVLIQTLFTAVSGQRSAVAIVISTLIIAALFTPLRRRLQSWIDRRFYRAKYDAAKTLSVFAETARDEVNIEELTAELLNVVRETMRPDRVGLWLKADFDSRSISPPVKQGFRVHETSTPSKVPERSV